MRRRVVVVDNDPEVIDLLVTDLRATGHDVVAAAEDGEEAIRLCHEHGPDVLVTDYRMPPGPNGIEVTRRLRAELPEVAVVLYTNYRRDDLSREARRLGARLLLKGNIRALRRAVAEASPPAPTPMPAD